QRQFKVYESEDCSTCLLRSSCTKAKPGNNRKMMVNEVWEEHKEYVREKLSEEETNSIYRRRKIDVEPVFGFLKANLAFKRFSVRGKSKVKKEIGFALMAVNLRKYTANIMPNHDLYKNMKKVEIKFYLISTFLFLTSYVPASFSFHWNATK